MKTISDGQWAEFWAKVQRGQITTATFQAFLDASAACAAPNLDGLSETFEVVVDGRTVTCAWIPANHFAVDPSNQQVIDEITRRRLLCPSRDVAVAVFDLLKKEVATNHSIAIYGVVQSGTDGVKIVGYVRECSVGRSSGFSGLHSRGERLDRVLVVVPADTE